MSVFRTLFDIILFKSKPHDVPYNINYSIIAFVAACISGALPVSQSELIEQPFLFLFAQKATLAALIFAFLAILQKKERTTQTFLAYFGTQTYFQFAAYLSALLNIGVFLMIIAIWNFIVQIFIMRHALNIGKVQAFFITVCFHMTVLFVMTLVSPEQMKAIISELQQAQKINAQQ